MMREFVLGLTNDESSTGEQVGEIALPEKNGLLE